MTGILDLSLDTETRAGALGEALRARIAACAGVAADHLVLASTPGDARRGLAALGVSEFDDRTDQGAAVLESRVDKRPVIWRIGAEAAPLCAIGCASPADANALTLHLAQPALIVLEAGLDALKPAAMLSARADRTDRDNRVLEIAAWLREQAGVQAEACAHGLRLPAGAGAKLGLVLRETGEGAVALIGNAKAAERLAEHLGLSKGRRAATVRRSTKETDIALSVDLDQDGVSASTGVHFFDHMLDQIGRHAGIRLDVVCEGDVEVDAHHTIEDVCLALGEGLRQALGDKRGIARFGFETPMDETRASVWIDLSGRPYCRFEGDIPGERVGDFPIEMCAHAFRSLAETMKAAIHVKVEGENAHHMVESCFKSFGRALRMAKTIEGDALPSTKGVL